MTESDRAYSAICDYIGATEAAETQDVICDLTDMVADAVTELRRCEARQARAMIRAALGGEGGDGGEGYIW